MVLVGSFAAELAAKTWEEIQNELNENEPSNLSTNISLNSSTLNDAVSGSSRVNESTSDWQRLLGVQDSEIPSWLLGLKQGLEGAWERVGLVMEDEVCTTACTSIHKHKLTYMNMCFILYMCFLLNCSGE